jgi:hypothetical protein
MVRYYLNTVATTVTLGVSQAVNAFTACPQQRGQQPKPKKATWSSKRKWPRTINNATKNEAEPSSRQGHSPRQ